MSQRDDIVIRPRIGRIDAKGVTGIRQERAVDAARRRQGGLFARARQFFVARRISRVRRVASPTRARLSLRAGTAVRSTGLLGRAAAAAGRTPVGLLAVAGVVASGVTVRLLSGRSFENLGAALNQRLLGDLDEQALAGRDAREAILANPQLAQIVGQEGRVNSQIAELYEFQRQQAYTERRGRSIFEQDPAFQSNGVADILILRARDAIMSSFNSRGGPQAVERIRERIGNGDGAR